MYIQLEGFRGHSFYLDSGNRLQHYVALMDVIFYVSAAAAFREHQACYAAQSTRDH